MTSDPKNNGLRAQTQSILPRATKLLRVLLGYLFLASGVAFLAHGFLWCCGDYIMGRHEVIIDSLYANGACIACSYLASRVGVPKPVGLVFGGIALMLIAYAAHRLAHGA
jgi:hypothetical protein